MKNNRNEQAEQTETKAKRWEDKEKAIERWKDRKGYERKQEEKCVARKKNTYRDIQNKTSGVCS